MSLSAPIIKKLDDDLDKTRVKVKKIKGRPDAEYLETYDVINAANAIFGYGGWGTKVINIEMIPADGKTICVATVQLDVDGCLPQQDVGVVVSAGGSPEALETAAKGAVSDGLKRNFRHYGKQFGNDLYAKDGDAPQAKRAPLPKAAAGQPATAKEAKTEHISVRFWRYVKDKKIDEVYARDVLTGGGDADYEVALADLKAEWGE